MREGSALVYYMHTTGGLIIVEHEAGMLVDLEDCLEKIAPLGSITGTTCAATTSTARPTSDTSLIGVSVTVPVLDGDLLMGGYQDILRRRHGTAAEGAHPGDPGTGGSMTNRIDHLLFWTGGVVLPRLSSLALASLPVCGRDLALERRLLGLEGQLAGGACTPAEFCEQAAAAAGAHDLAPSLPEAMLARSQTLPGVVGVLDDLAPRVRLGLLSDYPRPWLQTIMDGTELARFFSPEEIHYTVDWQGADLFTALVAGGVIRPGHTLWVDYNSPRSGSAIRRGIDAALCVDVRRLRRDLGLWSILPRASE